VKAKDVILRVREEIPFDYREMDISGNETLERDYGSGIPVVFIDGRKAFKFKVDENRFKKSLMSRLR
jgi:hypothetical protein